jgi:hypothetical protein
MGLNPELTQSRLGLNPGWTQPRQGPNFEFLSTLNDTVLPSKYKIFTVFFECESRCTYIKRMDLKNTIVYSSHENQIIKYFFLLELKLWAIRG